MATVFKRVLANGTAFDYSRYMDDDDCKAHATKVMGIPTDETTIELHNHEPLGYCNPCMDMEDDDEWPTDIRNGNGPITTAT